MKTENVIQDQKNEIMFDAGRKLNNVGGKSTWQDYFKQNQKIEKVKGKKTELLTYKQACFLLKKIDLTDYLFNADASSGLRLDFLFDYNNNEIRLERKNVERLAERLKV